MPKYSTEKVACLTWVNFSLSLRVLRCAFSGAMTEKLLAVLQATWRQKHSACICVPSEDVWVLIAASDTCAKDKDHSCCSLTLCKENHLKEEERRA